MFLGQIAVLAWFGLIIPTLVTNVKLAWGESRRMRAGVILTTIYLVSAVVMGLIRKSDLQSS